jgi:hypothetical protein
MNLMLTKRSVQYLRLALYLLLITELISCKSSQLSTSWKSELPSLSVHSRILVAAVVPGNERELRTKLEDRLCADLNKLGYPAFSAIKLFGIGGLAGLEQEETFLKLCDRDIDAVLTVAAVPANTNALSTKNYFYPNSYYFSKLWSYRNMYGEAPAIAYYWEFVLFDLSQLRVRVAVGSAGVDSADLIQSGLLLGTALTRKLVRDKILQKQNPKAAAKRAF